MTRAPALAAVLDDFFAAYYRRNPVSATFIGIHDHDDRRSEEHTSELQSQSNLVCRLLLEKKKNEPKHYANDEHRMTQIGGHRNPLCQCCCDTGEVHDVRQGYTLQLSYPAITPF